MKASFPLVRRELSDPIAFLTQAIAGLDLDVGPVSTQRFLEHVHALGAILDEQSSQKQHVINLCDNRYLFLVSFCAVITRGQTNLLPPNKNATTQTQLSLDYANTYIIHDNSCELAHGIPAIDITDYSFKKSAAEPTTSIPHIANQHLACISFTSGSTGKSKPNLKYWHTLHTSTAINYSHMIPATSETLYVLATVPAQHMWGLETSILMGLFHNICTSDQKPLFPQDILDTLACLPAPRLLVSTPVHLRALAASNENKAAVDIILCATSPLGAQLAKEVEAQFSAQVREVYGCSEVGSMAVKKTATEDTWLRFKGINFEAKGEFTFASASHLPEVIPLQDKIELLAQNRFSLAGRASDLVKIAGKRGSLFDINHILLDFDGLQDGVVILPESNSDVRRLCAIVSLKQGVTKAMLRAHLRKYLDSAFVPRPIYVVEALPREANGKLSKARISLFLEQLKTKSS